MTIETRIANIKAYGFREVFTVSGNQKKGQCCSRKKLEIVVTCVHTPDAEARLSRALDMLLEMINRGSSDEGSTSNEKIKLKRNSNSKNTKGGKT